MKQLESIYYNDLLASIIHDQTATNPIIIGISGNVAVGKSTFAKRLVRRLQQTLTDKKIELICTDDFLFANQVLRQKALFDRKGFPESYDLKLVDDFIAALATHQSIVLPIYDHRINDVSARLTYINCPDIVVVEGLMAMQAPFYELLDVGVFLEAAADDTYQWYQERCQKAHMDEWQSKNFQQMVATAWAEVDVPNYQQYVAHTKQYADVVLTFDRDHQLIDMYRQQPMKGGHCDAVYN